MMKNNVNTLRFVVIYMGDNISYKTLMSLDGKKEINMLTATYDNNGRLVFG